MPTPPKLTETAIRNWAGEASLAKGQPYFRNGSIINPRRQGDWLKAQCIGSAAHPYRVTIKLDAQGIGEGSCSCPVGYGGRCKHGAALLLAWMNDPESFTEIEELRAALEKRTKEELIALLLRMLDRQPDLENLLELATLSSGAASAKPLDPKVIERQVNNVFKNFDYEDGYGSAGGEAAAQLQDVKQLGDQYAAAGDWRNAVLVYQTLADGVLDNYEMIGEGDEEGDLAEVVNDCVSGLGEALGAVQEAGLRETVLHALWDIHQWDANFGGIDMGYEASSHLLELTTPAEKKVIAQWVRNAMPNGDDWTASYRRQGYGGFLLGLEADTLDDETFLRICRETGRALDLVERLLSLHRVEEALAAAQKASDYDLLNMELSFTRHDQAALFARLITERARTSTDRRLKDWLKAHAVQAGDQETVLRYTEEMFWDYPSLDSYKELQKAAQAVNRWPQLQPQLMARLSKEQRHSGLLTQIYLQEGDIDRALQMVQKESGSLFWGASSLRLEVARAAEQKRPRAALEIYLPLVKQQINGRNRESYRNAAGYLSRIRNLYQALNEENNWRQLITKIRAEHKNLPALKDELSKAGL
ncbi:MAG: SWIM zinc finger family protein [Caldilineaceae bacterium]